MFIELLVDAKLILASPLPRMPETSRLKRCHVLLFNCNVCGLVVIKCSQVSWPFVVCAYTSALQGDGSFKFMVPDLEFKLMVH